MDAIEQEATMRPGLIRSDSCELCGRRRGKPRAGGDLLCRLRPQRERHLPEQLPAGGHEQRRLSAQREAMRARGEHMTFGDVTQCPTVVFLFGQAASSGRERRRRRGRAAGAHRFRPTSKRRQPPPRPRASGPVQRPPDSSSPVAKPAHERLLIRLAQPRAQRAQFRFERIDALRISQHDGQAVRVEFEIPAQPPRGACDNDP